MVHRSRLRWLELAVRLTGCVQSGTDLFQQLLAAVRFWNKAAKTLGEHRSDFGLLGEPAAQDNIYLWIDRAQLLKHGVSINHRQKVIENDETDLLAHLFVDFERLKAIMRDYDPIALFGQHFRRQVGHVGLVLNQEQVLAVAARIFDSDTRWNTVVAECWR